MRFGAVNSSTNTTVRNTLIGSFRPDSTSSAAIARAGTAARERRSRTATAAASVGAVAAPSRSASGQETPNSKRVAAPATPALIATPAVARAIDGHSARRIMLRSVLRPPWNSIIASATLPTR